MFYYQVIAIFPDKLAKKRLALDLLDHWLIGLKAQEGDHFWNI